MQRLQAGRHSLGERPKGILKQRLVDGISDHLGVGRRMEYRASRLEAVAELLCAHQVAVVRHRHTAPSQAKQERLDVFDGIVACRCIAHMSQGDFTGTQLFQARLTEGLPHQPGSAVEAEAIPSAHDDSTAHNTHPARPHGHADRTPRRPRIPPVPVPSRSSFPLTCFVCSLKRWNHMLP